MAKVKAKEIIVSHPGADFDSLASMVAASKLYPEAQMVLLAGMDIGVREFYALYRDTFPILLLRQIDQAYVERVIITDTSKLSRVRSIKELLERVNVEIILYDHHIDEEGEIRADFSHCYRYGSTTTILIEEIAKRGIELTPEEATLLCLGIYEDTGNLTYSSTTPEDLDAVKYLLNAGANLRLMRRYISHELSPEQKVLMQKLTLNTRDMLINGIRVHFATARIPGFVDEIAFITSKIQELENADCIFVLVEVRGRVYIIGRSRIAPVNVAHALSYFGGGGHPSAGSAMLKDANQQKVLQELIAILKEELRPYVIARDIMSSPVSTIPPETTIDECRDEMIRLGHSGLVVMGENGELRGIISRRDIDKAILSGRLNDAVETHMKRDVITAREEAGLHQLEKIIIRYNVGRIPIVFGGKPTGIVTRSDIIRALHEIKPVGDEEMEDLPLDGHLIQEDVFKGLQRQTLNILILAGRVADQIKMSVFLVGGIVRDILRDKPSEDVDLVIDGDGITFAKALGLALGLKVDENPRFGTAKIHTKMGGTIDIAGSRKEYYEEYGALPLVKPGNIEDDLKRRDFTINSIAIRINHFQFGQILDPFNGRKDVENGVIRVLHTKSFLDDPTRMFRAMRFASRFGFEIDERSRALIKEALSEKMLRRITKQRIRDELWLILKDRNPHIALQMLDKFHLLNEIHPDFSLPAILSGESDPVKPVLEQYQHWDLPYTVRTHQIYLCILMWDFVQKTIDSFSKDFQIAGNDDVTIKDIPRFREQMNQISSLAMLPKPSEIHHRLQAVQIEVLLTYLATSAVKELQEMVKRFLREIKPTKLDIDGQDLQNLGFPPSPSYKKAFKAVFNAKLDGLIQTRQEELNMAEEVLENE